MEDPNLLDAPLSIYSGEITLTLTIPVEAMRGEPDNEEAIATDIKGHLMTQLSDRGVFLPLILEDWELIETKNADVKNIFDEADDNYESDRDDK